AAGGGGGAGAAHPEAADAAAAELPARALVGGGAAAAAGALLAGAGGAAEQPGAALLGPPAVLPRRLAAARRGVRRAPEQRGEGAGGEAGRQTAARGRRGGELGEVVEPMGVHRDPPPVCRRPTHARARATADRPGSPGVCSIARSYTRE